MAFSARLSGLEQGEALLPEVRDLLVKKRVGVFCVVRKGGPAFTGAALCWCERVVGASVLFVSLAAVLTAVIGMEFGVRHLALWGGGVKKRAGPRSTPPAVARRGLRGCAARHWWRRWLQCGRCAAWGGGAGS